MDPPSPATPGYLMAPISGNPPLYYLATKYGGITVITRIYVPVSYTHLTLPTKRIV